MRTLFGLVGTLAGGWLGWWLGEQVGLMTAVILGSIGSGAGLYFGRRLLENLLD
jgi:hypothetical protein